MSAVRGTIRDGKPVFDGPLPADWQDGAGFRAELDPAIPVGIREEYWPTTPEVINDWVAWYRTVEPLVMSAEEETAWLDALKRQKEWELANRERPGEGADQ